MDEVLSQLKTILGLMGFEKAEVLVDEAHRKISIIIDDPLSQTQIPVVLMALDHLVNLILRKKDLPPYVLDLNYYRKERERLIAELARAAAHKAVITKAEVELPPMNAYERRLVHMELTTHPELKTESVGTSKDRHVVIKHIE